jgi:anti-sigma factor RsiW
MTASCRDYELLLSTRAAGALDAASSARLEAHLSSCEACRTEAEGLAEAVGLARVPPPAEAELRAMEGLQARVFASWRRAQRSRGLRRRLAVGLAVAAAAAAMVLAPGALRRQPRLAEGTPTTAAAVWQEPDLDELWAASSSVDSAAEDETALDEGILYAAIEDNDAF